MNACVVAFRLALTTLVVTFLVAACSSEPPPPLSPMEEAKQYSRLARVACEEFGRQRLKAPSTAKFLDNPTIDVNYPSLGTYSVSGAVDAQNVYGVMLRAQYECRVYRDGAGNWRLESFDLME